MVFPWFSYGFPIKTSIFLWFSYGFPTKNSIFPWVFPWFSFTKPHELLPVAPQQLFLPQLQQRHAEPCQLRRGADPGGEQLVPKLQDRGAR